MFKFLAQLFSSSHFMNKLADEIGVDKKIYKTALTEVGMVLPHRSGPPYYLGKRRAKMATKRHKTEEIVTKLRQVEVLVGQGTARVDAIRQVRITEQTYYRWRKQYGGMGTDQLKELKRLQKENERLRKAVSDLTLDKLILKEAARGNF